MNRILVLTGDRTGPRMAGPAIRAYEISRFLSSRHRVTLAGPEGTMPVQNMPENLQVVSFGVEPKWRDMGQYDAVIIPASMHVDAHFDTPVLVDLYDPFILSSLARSDKTETKQVEELHSLAQNLQRGDFFVCASERQRDFWIGMLAATGRVNVRQFQNDPHLNALIQPAPFGIASTPPGPGPNQFPGNTGDHWIVWAGGIWDWFDPLTPISAVHTLNKLGRKVSLFFMGSGHPNPVMTQMTMIERARQRADELGVLNRSVFFGDWIPYDSRGSILSKAFLGISTHYPHLETRFSYRTRILDYIWSRLPFVCTEGDYFADIAASRSLGTAVPPEDEAAIVAAVTHMLDTPAFYASCRDNLNSIANTMTWDKVLAPVMNFCSAPARACDTGRLTPEENDPESGFCMGCETAVVPAGEILRGGLMQEFSVPCGGIRRIDLKLATYDRLNTGRGIFEVLDPQDQPVVCIPFDLATVRDNHWHPFRFGPIPAKPGSTWKIRLACPDSMPGNALTAWVDDSLAGTSFTINGRQCPGSINFRVFSQEYPGSDQAWKWGHQRYLGLPWRFKR